MDHRIVTDVGAMIRREIAPERVAEHARALSGAVDELWVVEDLPFAGGISQLAAVLGATETVRVGHGIAPAPFRNPVALAMEWATIARMYPARLEAGVGHGVQAWMRQVGSAVESPLALLEENLDCVRRLLAGETVLVDGRYVSVDGVKLEFPPPQPIRVSAGVTGPRSLELSGRSADGTILGEGHAADGVRKAALTINRGMTAAGREGAHRLTVFSGFHLGQTAPDRASGWNAVDPSPERVASALAGLADAGADAIVLVPLGPEPESQLEQAVSDVIPTLRALLAEKRSA
jgi:alkanesulfonate monooxygenase SsuD/methylene tetrahydromethanopterin reductase-like flavin-dependent oxidoreductase (luciferase family)